MPYFSARNRKYLRSILACLALAACAGNTSLAQLRGSGPAPGFARIVVAYPAPFLGDNGMAQVRYNKGAFCDLPAGSYSVHEVKPGLEKLNFSFCGERGGTELSLRTEAGGRYYVRILPYDSSLRGMISGYPSENPPRSAVRTRQPNLGHGPFQAEFLDEAEAFKILADLAPAK